MPISQPKLVLILVHDHERRVKLRWIYENSGHFVISATTGVDALALMEKISVPVVRIPNSETEFKKLYLTQTLTTIELNVKTPEITEQEKH